MSVTIAQIVQDAQGVLGEADGVGTQTYSEPRMIQDAGRAFNLIFKKRFWEQYTKWTTVILDGTTGVITTNAFTQVLEFEDFAKVCPANKKKGIPTLPPSYNPNTVGTGSSPLYFTSLHVSHANYAGRKLQIYPVTATGSLDIRARFHPLTVGNEWVEGSILYFDRDLLSYATAYTALATDDLNPSATAVAQTLMDNRYKEIEQALADQDTATSSRSDIPDEWYANR